MPNRTVLPPLLAELARRGRARRGDHAALRHRDPPPGHRGRDGGARRARRRGPLRRSSTTSRTTATTSRWARSTATPILLQRHYVEADVRIITGFVEPHFFAGFSGGPKGVCPGLAATATILEAHHPRRIADARATFVTRTGNPVHDFVRAAVALAPPHLSLDVTINRAAPADRGVRRPAARDATTPPAPSSDVGRRSTVDAPFDVVVSHQRRATRSTATCTRRSRAWRRPSGSCATGGIIVMAAACADGVPDDGAFARVLAAAAHARRPGRRAGAARAGPLAGPGARPRAAAGPRSGSSATGSSATTIARGACCGRSPTLTRRRRRRAGAGRARARRVAVLPEGPLTVATRSPAVSARASDP